MKTQKKLASIIIVNFNNARLLKKSIESCLNQDYNFLEIIVVDDQSTDNTLSVIKKFKNKIKFLTTSKKTVHGSYNQMNAYKTGLDKCKGEVVFFLDSDDFFLPNKIRKIMRLFNEKMDIKIIFDLYYFGFSNKKIKANIKVKKLLISSWPRFSPQSCISIRRNYAKKIFEKILIKKFNFIWLDFRLAIFSFLDLKKIFLFKEYLTVYRQNEFSASKEFVTFSKKWWLRRNQAHNFYSFCCKKLNIKDRFTLDRLITKIIYLIIK